MRIVLDTNVLVAGLSSRRGASHVLLRHALERRLRLLAAPALWLEYEDVLKRAEIRRLRGLSGEEVDAFLDALALLTEPVSTHFRWRPQLCDAKDEMVLGDRAQHGRGGARHLQPARLPPRRRAD